MKLILRYLLYAIIALLLALSIRVFLFNFYMVPGDSMEPTILPGDFILADKWTYGARIFTNLKFDSDSDPPVKRVSGLRSIQRNDVVVFNSIYRRGWDTILMNMEQVMVKRCIGIPGDSISIVDSYYRVAGITDTLGYVPGQRLLERSRSSLDSVIVRTIPGDTVLFHWDVHNLGPLLIPASGTTITLTPENFILYQKQIAYETRASVYMKDLSVFINDTLRHTYTFRSNWYFVAGDKAVNSQDSRYTGLIPENYIIGRASFIITSTDSSLGKQRWQRTFKRIK